jgi:hypothetical protein
MNENQNCDTQNPQEPMSYGESETKEKIVTVHTFWPEYIYDISPNSAIL